MTTVWEQALELRKRGRDGFLAEAVPVLIEVPPRALLGKGADTELLTKPLDGPLLRGTVEADGATFATRSRKVADEAVVHLVRKRPMAAFSDRIGVGRTGNNDVVLSFAGVSKYHCYFAKAPEGWKLSDAGSRNGTFVDDEKLVQGQAKLLDDECIVRIGTQTLLFMTPPAWVAFLEAR